MSMPAVSQVPAGVARPLGRPGRPEALSAAPPLRTPATLPGPGEAAATMKAAPGLALLCPGLHPEGPEAVLRV